MEHYARKINNQTDISDSVILCIPESFDKKRLEPHLKEYCRNVAVEVNPATLKPGKPVILIGNLSDSTIVKDLYFRFLATTDLWYPGPGGYEIRTLLDPYGYGENIIHIGYSDEEGLEKAIEKFIPYIGKAISKISEIHPTRLHIHESEAIQIRAIKPPKLIWMNVARDIYKKGYLGYL